MKGRKHSAASRRKLSLALKGKGKGNTYAKGLTPWNKGITWLGMSGENHWNWQGGITTENTKRRRSPEYKAWRLSVFKRDWYKCVICGEKQPSIEAHHIRTVNDYPLLITQVNNGVTLCVPCHEELRGKENEHIGVFDTLLANKGGYLDGIGEHGFKGSLGSSPKR